MDEAKARELLARERARIERSLSEHGIEISDDGELTHLDQHLADQATELFDEELDQSLVETFRDQLAAIKRAERRLEEGKYGLSVESGEPIPDARLELIPWAERTAEEQARFERGF
jgi:DnaK suppressor protein